MKLDPGYKWKVLESQELYKGGFFRLRTDRCELGDGRIAPRYFVMEVPHWVHVVPITKDKQVVLVKQYRHASGEVSIEIPGGATHPHTHEDAAVAGLRELEEETGYTTKNFQFISKHRPNPALQDNFLYTYLALDCEKKLEQSLDPYEEIEVITKSIPETIQMALKGEINHSLVLASLFHCLAVMGYPLK